MSKDVLVSKVVRESGQLVMLFQPEVLKKMNLKEGTIYMWEFQEDGSIIVTPTNYTA